MPRIKCPNCNHEIVLDKSDYDALLNDIEKEELNRLVNEKEKQLKEFYELKLDNETNSLKTKQDDEINKLKSQVLVLQEKLNNSDNESKLKIKEALENKEKEIIDSKETIIKLQNEVNNVKKDAQIEMEKLKSSHLTALELKEAEIKKYKEFRMGDSTKDLGESLEQYCYEEFEGIHALMYPNATFEKDNLVDEFGKGDFIFRNFDDEGNEIVSIMFEMKNQKDDTEKKHKNEEFFKKLDKNRTSKECEYAVLVTTLEEDSKLYNKGIVDVSHRYPKMFVIRPQFFLTIIGLISKMANEAFKAKKQVIIYQRENVDVTNFENAVMEVANKINKDYENAAKIYSEVDDMCDAIIKKVETFRKDFKVATGWIEKAKNQLPNLEVRKLTRHNPTMKAKFDELKDKE